jgi:thiosulfate/3-mercaptopyruvate sulfurtransferase
LTDKLTQLGLNQNQQVIVYDANNSMMAARAWWLLRELGHEAVAVLDGGIAEWQKQGCGVSKEIPSISATGSFSAQPSLNATVTANEILARLNDRHYTVIDARAPERYRGDVEPIDPVGGHIPHAINAFFMGNLNDKGRFKDAQVLREQWQTIFGKKPIQQIVNQCGSGVTACHNILAQHIAGLKGAALYPGSWSEWCADTARPVATGSD